MEEENFEFKAQLLELPLVQVDTSKLAIFFSKYKELKKEKNLVH